MSPLVIALFVLSGVGLIMASLLALGRKAFAVEVDERHEKLMEIIPGANCGGCGYPGCSGYATALVEGTAAPTLCPPGGAELAQEIGRILGVEVGEVPDQVAVVLCAGDRQKAPERADYLGIANCHAAAAVAGGVKRCPHGCLGLGSCAEACPFEAIEITEENLAVVLPRLCTGCGKCVETCPRGIIEMLPRRADVHVLCQSQQKPKAVKQACSVGCTGCKLCVKASSRFTIEGTLARVDWAAEDEIPLEVSLECPQGSIFDGRRQGIWNWLTDPEARKAHEQATAAYKEARKAAKKKAKNAAETESAKAGPTAVAKQPAGRDRGEST
jgi:electron transport complex protein RnfB